MRFVYNIYHQLNNDPVICLRRVKPLLSYYDYPRENFIMENHAYIIVGDQPILITKIFNFDDYNELSWLHKEEIRILSALSLCAPNIGWYSFYVHEATYVSDSNAHSFDLRDNNIVNELLSFASKKLGIDLCLNIEKKAKVENEEYLCPPEVLFNAIDITNDTLIKALNYWVKACMLLQHRQFNEEATALLFFSMEGILKLFHKELQSEYSDVRVTDVIDYLIQTFDVPEGYKDYTVMCYELRNNYVHPFESGWNGNFVADDMLETFNVLKDIIYIYLTRNPSIESSRIQTL